MNNDKSLSRQISKAKAELIARRANPDDEDGTLAVLFTGNWHAAIPRKLVIDQTLSPVEKITWQAIRFSITDPSRPGATPRRDELAAMINCSAPTVTTSRTMLRICRWMTFCESVRAQGRFVGDIYLFNDEPISLAATLQVDSSYVSFLQQQAQSGSKRLRTVAASLLREIDSANTLDLPTELEQISGRFTTLLNSQKTATHRSKIFTAVEKVNDGAENSVETGSNADAGSHSKIFAVDEHEENSAQTHRSKIFAAVESDHSKFFTGAKNFFPLARGSSNNNSINNKYTPAREAETESGLSKDNAGETNEPFVRFNDFNYEMDFEKTFTLVFTEFPQLASPGMKPYLTLAFGLGKENQLPVIKRIICKLPEPTRTYVLLQLIGRYAADNHGWTNRPLDKPIAFTKKLVERALTNEFFPDEWALALETAIALGEDPCFPDSPELIRRKRLYGATGEAEENN